MRRELYNGDKGINDGEILTRVSLSLELIVLFLQLA
jgi:hypothetical protein